MDFEKISKKTYNFYSPRFEVAVEGKKLNANMSKAIIDVSVDEKKDEGASFTLTMNDEFDVETQEYKWLDHPIFKEGNKVSIKMGYADKLDIMMVGEITSIEPSFFSGETPTLKISGQDMSYDYIKKPSKERAFKDMSFSDIAKDIAIKADLIPVVDNTEKYKCVIRKDSNKTYYAFLMDLAKRVGYQFDVNKKTMYFVKPKDDEDEILTLELKKDVISFSPSIKTGKLVTEVEVRGHNEKDPNTPIVGRASAGSERSQEGGKKKGSQAAKKSNKKVITNVVVCTQAEANALAKSELNRASDTFIEGSGECIGLPVIRKGVNIKLEKMGKRFSGKYYVRGTTHTINNNGYRTTFSVKRNAI